MCILSLRLKLIYLIIKNSARAPYCLNVCLIYHQFIDNNIQNGSLPHAVWERANLNRSQAVWGKLISIGAKKSGAKLIRILFGTIKLIRPIKIICLLGHKR